jgi:hypothetical protein
MKNNDNEFSRISRNLVPTGKSSRKTNKSTCVDSATEALNTGG